MRDSLDLVEGEAQRHGDLGRTQARRAPFLDVEVESFEVGDRALQ